MWDSFVVWGQSYGLWATTLLLAFMCISSHIENARVKKALEDTREEKKFFEDRYNEFLGGDGNEPPANHR